GRVALCPLFSYSLYSVSLLQSEEDHGSSLPLVMVPLYTRSSTFRSDAIESDHTALEALAELEVPPPLEMKRGKKQDLHR
ncbi:hypothetical protein J6590_100209, partial [Homalodisca vitripennis]